MRPLSSSSCAMLLFLFLCVSFLALTKGKEEGGILDASVYLSSEVSIPRVGFGSCGLRNTAEMTCVALKNGVKLIDSAQARGKYCYDNTNTLLQRVPHVHILLLMYATNLEWYNEVEVGNAIRSGECQAPEDLIVVTKIHPRSYEINAMRASLDKSAIDLYGEKKKLDVVLLHAPFCWEGHCNEEQTHFLRTAGWYTAWRNLEKMHDEGRVAAVGVSNFTPQQLKELLSFANKRVAVVQNFMVTIIISTAATVATYFFNATIADMAESFLICNYEQDPFNHDREVLRMCEEHNIAYMAYR